MNIFYLHSNARVCAEMHNDKHTVKMVLEYAQLLSTAHRVLDGDIVISVSKTGRKQTRYVLPDERETLLYSASHINHPSAIWSRQSFENYRWLANLLFWLCKEYTHRYGKVHKVEQTGLMMYLLDNVPNRIDMFKQFTQPTPAMPDDVKNVNSVKAYQDYYIKYKQHLAKWSGKINSRPTPEWYNASL